MNSTAAIADTIDRATHTVLVVDDNPATRYSTGRVLRSAGFRIAEAGTGAEALEQAFGGKVSAVVLDVHLPDVDGFEVCRRIRAGPATRLLPVVHLSAEFVRDEHHVQGLDAGADGYLIHPVEPAVLVATLQALIRARSAEDELRRSERRFRAIHDQAQAGIAVVDADGRFADANPAMLRMLARTREQLIGLDVASIAAAGSREVMQREFMRPVQEPWSGDVTLLRPDGSAVHMQWSMSQQVGNGLRIATAADVSDKHEIEQQRHELLEREQAARAQAERHSRTKDDFIAVLSHELRTPLNAIIGWVHILKRRGVLPEGMRGLDAIERNVKTQARIISDILDVSRINSGKLLLELQPVDAAELVRDSLGALSATIEERRIRLETQIDDGNRPAWIDPARYQQIIWNLVTNAVKFSIEAAEMRVTLAREGDQLRLEVRDFGAGINPEFLPHLFERFTQSDSPGNRRHGGLGLGLSIVKHLVDLHGGTVEAHSEGLGRGTLMRVVLPVQEPSPAADAAPADEAQETGGGPVADLPGLHGVDVLVVEDDAEAADMMRIVLADHGAHVRVARDYERALDELAARRPDVLVSDIGLPGRDGYELAQRVRIAEAGTTRIPMIALTAFARPQDRQRSLEAGFDRHLPKPLKPHTLMAAIRELLPARGPFRTSHGESPETMNRSTHNMVVDTSPPSDSNVQRAAPEALARDWPFIGGGEMGQRMRAHDWSHSPLGPVARWPRALKVAVSTLLECQLPMFVAWGDRFIQFYNDAYRPILGNKHPAALGASTPECWSEIWPRIGPMWERVRAGEPIGFEDFQLTIERYGYPEDCYFNFSYSPVRNDEGRAAGVLVTFAETTRRVRSEARSRFLDELAQATRIVEHPEQVMRIAAGMLGRHLRANRCAYAQVLDDQDTFDLIGDFNDGVDSIVGRYRFTDFGQAVQQLMLANEPYVNHDVDTDPRTEASDLSSYRATRIRSAICVPLLKHGRLVAAMAVHQAAPRHWTPEEVELVRTVVDRCWEALERVRSNAALADANRRLALAMDAAELGDWSWDADSDVVLLSEAASDTFGLPRNEPVTWASLRGLLHEEDRERARLAVESALSDRSPYAAEYRLPLPDGDVRWISARGRGLYGHDGEVTGMIGVVQDVTARRLEQEHAATETRLLEVLNRTGTALSAELELEALLQRVTDAATELTGAKFGAFFYNAVDGQGDAYMLYTLSGAPREAFEHFGHPRATPLFGPTFRGAPPIRVDDILQDPRYGQWGPHKGMPKGHLPVRSYLSVPVVSRTGDVIGGLFFGHPSPGMFSDRSERLAVGIAGQAAIAVDNARLYAQAHQLADERKSLLESERAARSDAERASQLKDEFLATLSHELRTPLSAILGWVHILRRKLDGSSADLVKGVDVIERSTRIQVQLIDDLLDMSRITSGKLRLEMQALAPVSVVQAAVDVIAPAAEAAGVSLSVSTEPVDSVLGDAGRLQQVVWNLLANAVKFTPRGGSIGVSLRPLPGQVQFTVSDSGVGIKPEFLPHLFERFRQADGSITRRFGGLGLGLSIVRHLVELHGGTVRAESEGEGRGSRFVIELPAIDTAAPLRSAPADIPGTTDFSGVRMLVVDDEPDARDLLVRLLAESGADVRPAAGAEEALVLVRSHRPAVLVSDIGMPGIDGYELIRRIRRLSGEDGRSLCAVALTAFARPEDRERALQAGFDEHVAKPLEPPLVLSTVARLLARKR